MPRGLRCALLGAMLLLGKAAAASSPSPTHEEHWQSETPQVFVEGARLHYYGKLNDVGAERLREALAGESNLRELHIASPGGDVLASISIGEQIQAHDLTVVVVGVGCASGCANYVFTPARRRVISPGSLVLWHYSCPERFPARRRQIARTLRQQFSKPGFAYSAEEDGHPIQDPVRLQENFEQNLDRLVDAHLAFVTAYRAGHNHIFASTGIDPSIICMADHVRLPKVPDHHIAFFYTLSQEDMARFGVCDVEMRPDYAEWAARKVAEHEELREYAGVLQLSRFPRFQPRPSRPCSTG